MPDWTITWALIALAVLPTTDLASILTAFLAKRLGVKPGEIEKYQEATDGDDAD
jgi:hypothetical protein